MASSIDSCFSPVLGILLLLTNSSIMIVVLNSPSVSPGHYNVTQTVVYHAYLMLWTLIYPTLLLT